MRWLANPLEQKILIEIITKHRLFIPKQHYSVSNGQYFVHRQIVYFPEKHGAFFKVRVENLAKFLAASDHEQFISDDDQAVVFSRKHHVRHRGPFSAESIETVLDKILVILN